jgi:hypothetical protein
MKQAGAIDLLAINPQYDHKYNIELINQKFVTRALNSKHTAKEGKFQKFQVSSSVPLCFSLSSVFNHQINELVCQTTVLSVP